MGMLMHHTWLEQQEKAKLNAEKPVEEETPFCEPVPAEEAEATAVAEASEAPEQPKQNKKTAAPKAPAKKPGGRRAVTKK